MSTFFQDLGAAAQILGSSAAQGLIGVCQQAIVNIEIVEAQDIASRKAVRDVLRKRKEDPEYQRQLNIQRFTEWLESTGKYKPNDEGMKAAVQQALEDAQNI